MFGLGMGGDTSAKPEDVPMPSIIPEGAPSSMKPQVDAPPPATAEAPPTPPAPVLAPAVAAQPVEVVKPSDKPQVPASPSNGINWLALVAALGVVWLATKYLRRS